MVTITDMMQNLTGIDLLEEVSWAIVDTREELIKKQQDQLLQGWMPDNKRIGRYKNSSYARRKNQLNPLAGLGNVDLKLTGEFHKGIFVDVRKDEFVIDSSDEKAGDLIKKYGDPFGLDDQSQIMYVEESLEEAVLKRVKEKTGL